MTAPALLTPASPPSSIRRLGLTRSQRQTDGSTVVTLTVGDGRTLTVQAASQDAAWREAQAQGRRMMLGVVS